MSTIPASFIANVLPSVVSAGGQSLVLNGVMLTAGVSASPGGIGAGWRVPTGAPLSFSSASAVGAYFGLSSQEYAKSLLYFNGFLGASQLPATLLIHQFTPAPVAAWLRSAPISLSAVNGVGAGSTLSIKIDGYVRSTSTLDLSASTSLSLAAASVQTALNAGVSAAGASPSGAWTIAPVTTTFTGSIAGNTLTVTGTPTNPIRRGATITVGALASTQILEQLSGTTGGVGTYAVSAYQAVASGTSITATYGTLTLPAGSYTGAFATGLTLSATGITAGTQITDLGTGVGGAGTYFVSPSQTAGSTSVVTGTPTSVAVAYDSTQGGFFVTSGIIGAASTIDISSVSGTAATALGLTSASGAVVSQGSAGMTPQATMTAVALQTQNWATFFSVFDPDAGAIVMPQQQKLNFAQWTATTNAAIGGSNRFAYLAWDADPSPTLSGAATTSFGYICANGNSAYGGPYTGVCPIYDPTNIGHAAFMAGCIASINFNAINGRPTMAFRSQSGVTAAVTNQQIAANLISNAYNFYGAFATANQGFQFFYNGSVTGPFAWLDSYVNQIYMNAAFQLDFMELFTTINSVPYNAPGYALMEASCMTTIQQMITYGAIRVGVTLSSLQIAQVTNQSGNPRVAQAIKDQGWYFQVQPATPQTRAARTTPVTYFWYADGQSIQQITLNSVELM